MDVGAKQRLCYQTCMVKFGGFGGDLFHDNSAVMLFLLEKLMKILVLVAVLLATSAVVTAQSSNRTLLRSMHQSLDVMCRGGSGDSQITNDACDVRTKVSSLLRTIKSGKTKSNSELALSIYKDLNEMCHGYSGDLPETNQACDIRNEASALLQNLGYCWSGAWWKKCRS